MAWFLMLLAVGCFLMLFVTKSFVLGILCLVLALVVVVTATLMLLSARINNASRDLQILSTEELRALREQAEAKRAANAEIHAAPRGMSAVPSNTTPEPPSSASD